MSCHIGVATGCQKLVVRFLQCFLLIGKTFPTYKFFVLDLQQFCQCLHSSKDKLRSNRESDDRKNSISSTLLIRQSVKRIFNENEIDNLTKMKMNIDNFTSEQTNLTR